MSFVLIYTEGGHQKSSEPMLSLDLINQHIRDLYGHEDASAPIDVLAVQEVRDDAPRTWAIEYPPAPPAWTRVRVEDGDWAGRVFTVSAARYLVDDEGVTWSWDDALNKFGPLTEVVETEVEAAARRLRERRERGDLHTNSPDANIVLNHVLSGGTL